jgi:hypothetical protein
VVLPTSSGSLASLASYAAYAHALGMSVMWAMGDQSWWRTPATSTSASGDFHAFSAACGCTQNGALLSFVIRWLASLPGTYGYYAADDSMLASGDGARVASYVAQIKQQDAVHTVLISSANGSQTSTYEGSADMIGAEVYPVTTSSLMPAAANQQAWSGVAQSASTAQRSANRYGKQSAFILQAFTWGDNLSDGQAIGVCSSTDTSSSCYSQLRYPSAAEQLQLRNEVLTHAHPKLILWFSFDRTFGQAGSDTYSIYPTGAVAAARWNGLVSAIQAPMPRAQVARNNVRRPAKGHARRLSHTRRRLRRR